MPETLDIYELLKSRKKTTPAGARSMDWEGPKKEEGRKDGRKHFQGFEKPALSWPRLVGYNYEGKSVPRKRKKENNPREGESKKRKRVGLNVRALTKNG